MTGPELEALRKEHGITRRALAAALGLDMHTIYATERKTLGHVTPRKAEHWTSTIQALAGNQGRAQPLAPPETRLEHAETHVQAEAAPEYCPTCKQHRKLCLCHSRKRRQGP